MSKSQILTHFASNTGLVKYEDIDVYYDKENRIEFERGWVHSSRIYPFLCYIVQGLKKKKVN